MVEPSSFIKKIVLTGGPCAGKSTVQTMLSDVFENMGWKVFRVPETATILLRYMSPGIIDLYKH